jgi:hypothetical protein
MLLRTNSLFCEKTAYILTRQIFKLYLNTDVNQLRCLEQTICYCANTQLYRWLISAKIVLHPSPNKAIFPNLSFFCGKMPNNFNLSVHEFIAIVRLAGYIPEFVDWIIS